MTLSQVLGFYAEHSPVTDPARHAGRSGTCRATWPA
jgi:hypothetical protein